MKWKYINNTNNNFKIYEDGTVERLYFETETKNGSILKKQPRIEKTRKSNSGYEMVRYLPYGEDYVHRLVAKHFLNVSDKYYVNHIDGNKLNNHYSNLEWVTPKENGEHASKIGLINKNSEKRNKQAPLNAKKGSIKNRKYNHIKNVYEINSENNEIIKVYPSIYDINKRTDHIILSRNRAIDRIKNNKHHKNKKIKTYFLWAEDYKKYIKHL